MKALFINGSPRKNWNTHKLLESAMKGASDAGADTELVHLYDSAFKGCISCFACKLKGRERTGLCAFRDALTPTLQKAHEADIVVIGAPVYFSDVTGAVRSFIERFCFPMHTYNREDMANAIDRDKPLKKTAMIFTMNCTEEMFREVDYNIMLGNNVQTLDFVFGYSEALYVYDTYQFTDYSRYEANYFDPVHKAERRDKHFPEDLQEAYELGKRLTEV